MWSLMCYKHPALLMLLYPNHTTTLEHSSSRTASTHPARVEAVPLVQSCVLVRVPPAMQQGRRL